MTVTNEFEKNLLAWFRENEAKTKQIFHNQGDQFTLRDLLESNPLIRLAEAVDEHGGEGEGEEYWVVVKFTGHSGEVAYLKFDGSYASYVGSEFDSVFVVHPTQKTITVYE